MASGQPSWVWREMSGEGSLKSFTLPVPSIYSTRKFLWAQLLDYKKTESTGGPAEDWEQCKEVGTW